MRSSINPSTIGSHGEAVIAHLLEERGFRIVTKNYRTAQGEIDIIATDKELLIFVEVKTRAHKTVDMESIITRQKQRKIILTARHFLSRHAHFELKSCRFDVALIEQLAPHPKITYIEDAFNVSD